MGHGACAGQKPRRISALCQRHPPAVSIEYGGSLSDTMVGQGAGSRVLGMAQGDAGSGARCLHPYRVKKGRKLAVKRPLYGEWNARDTLTYTKKD